MSINQLTARGGRRGVALMCLLGLAAVALAFALVSTLNNASAVVAKPVKSAISPFIVNPLPDPGTPAANSAGIAPFSAAKADIHGFDEVGFIQAMTVSNAGCPNVGDATRYGGTITMNSIKITVPCNMVIQLPANTMKWSEFVNPSPTLGPALTIPLSAVPPPYPSFEMHAVGNIVGARGHVAGLLFASQQAANTGTGKITSIDYATGNITVAEPTGGNAVLQINDPAGRFGRAQSPDQRFSVDEQNPTIHSGTGYPMCVPRTADGNGDALCPQANRPKPVAGHCRDFSDAIAANVAPATFTKLPAGGNNPPPAAGQAFCSEFVMPAVGAGAGAPDPRQQVPFEVGDTILWIGTLVSKTSPIQLTNLATGATSVAPALATDFFSVNTIIARVGVYTQPGTRPAYVSLDGSRISTNDPVRTDINGNLIETVDRLFLEGSTTDVITPVDAYIPDVDPKTGAVNNRWITPFAMTSENLGGNPDGGIITQFLGFRSFLIRLHAPHAPVGLLNQPARGLRLVQRTLCKPIPNPVPAPAGTPGPGYDQAALNKCLADNAATGRVANGLAAGQYFVPMFDFIFPENLRLGDSATPFDLWHLPFLSLGEGPNPAGPAVGPLTPAPW